MQSPWPNIFSPHDQGFGFPVEANDKLLFPVSIVWFNPKTSVQLEQPRRAFLSKHSKFCGSNTMFKGFCDFQYDMILSD